MNILITSAASRLAQELAASLSKTHQVRLTDRRDVQTVHKFVRSDLGHDPATNDLVRGMDAVVHWGEPDANVSVSDRLDAAMRCIYNLLWAAVEEGVPRFVYLSSLRILDKYGEDLDVTARWRPVPTTEPTDLCYHLGEHVCREFAREKGTSVVCLRLGDLVWDDQAGAISTSALYPDDATQAVEKALTVEVTPNWRSTSNTWNVFHIQSSVPGQRYLAKTAQEALGYSFRQRG